MNSILRGIIDHHIWANDTLLDFCETLTPEQLTLSGLGTYGRVHDTLVHYAQGEQVYLSRIPDTGVTVTLDDETNPLPSVATIRAALRETGKSWLDIVDRWPDDLKFEYRTREGDEERGTVSFSVVQMLDHGAEHRNHIRTILSSHGIEPPEIDGWTWDEEPWPPSG